MRFSLISVAIVLLTTADEVDWVDEYDYGDSDEYEDDFWDDEECDDYSLDCLEVEENSHEFFITRNELIYALADNLVHVNSTLEETDKVASLSTNSTDGDGFNLVSNGTSLLTEWEKLTTTDMQSTVKPIVCEKSVCENPTVRPSLCGKPVCENPTVKPSVCEKSKPSVCEPPVRLVDSEYVESMTVDAPSTSHRLDTDTQNTETRKVGTRRAVDQEDTHKEDTRTAVKDDTRNAVDKRTTVDDVSTNSDRMGTRNIFGKEVTRNTVDIRDRLDNTMDIGKRSNNNVDIRDRVDTTMDIRKRANKNARDRLDTTVDTGKRANKNVVMHNGVDNTVVVRNIPKQTNKTVRTRQQTIVFDKRTFSFVGTVGGVSVKLGLNTGTSRSILRVKPGMSVPGVVWLPVNGFGDVGFHLKYTRSILAGGVGSDLTRKGPWVLIPKQRSIVLTFGFNMRGFAEKVCRSGRLHVVDTIGSKSAWLVHANVLESKSVFALVSGSRGISLPPDLWRKFALKFFRNGMKLDVSGQVVGKCNMREMPILTVRIGNLNVNIRPREYVGKGCKIAVRRGKRGTLGRVFLRKVVSVWMTNKVGFCVAKTAPPKAKAAHLPAPMMPRSKTPMHSAPKNTMQNGPSNMQSGPNQRMPQKSMQSGRSRNIPVQLNGRSQFNRFSNIPAQSNMRVSSRVPRTKTGTRNRSPSGNDKEDRRVATRRMI